MTSVRKTLVVGGKQIRKMIDFFYPPFRKFISLQFFRYGVSGALNLLVFDWALFSFLYNFVIKKQLVHLGFVTLSPYIAALFISFPIALFTGFLLQKYVTFTASKTRGSNQLMRYILIVILNLLVNYFGLKLLVGVLGFYPLPSKMLITIPTIIISYIAQKRFTFKVKNEEENAI